MVGNVQLGHRPEPEVQVRIGRAGMSAELRHEVDTADVSAQGVQVRGPVAGPAAEVEHRSGESGQVSSHQRGVILVIPAVDQGDVLLGDAEYAARTVWKRLTASG